MQTVITLMNEYIRSELLVLTPVLYIIARVLKDNQVSNRRLPVYLMLISICLAGIYTFAVTDVSSFPKVLMAIFSTLVQGILLSGTAIFGGILIKNAQKN